MNLSTIVFHTPKTNIELNSVLMNYNFIYLNKLSCTDRPDVTLRNETEILKIKERNIYFVLSNIHKLTYIGSPFGYQIRAIC